MPIELAPARASAQLRLGGSALMLRQTDKPYPVDVEVVPVLEILDTD
jgi:hypothetical protein